MIRRLLPLLYVERPLELESRFGLEESIRRLAGATERTPFSAMAQQRAVGEVTAERVCLQRVIPFVRNYFKPFFVARFMERNGRAVLVGAFQMNRWVRAFMIAWL